jgi:hypothetical protein
LINNVNCDDLFNDITLCTLPIGDKNDIVCRELLYKLLDKYGDYLDSEFVNKARQQEFANKITKLDNSYILYDELLGNIRSQLLDIYEQLYSKKRLTMFEVKGFIETDSCD